MSYQGYSNRITWNLVMWANPYNRQRFDQQYFYLMGEGYGRNAYAAGEYEDEDLSKVQAWTAERVEGFIKVMFPKGTPDLQAEQCAIDNGGTHPAMDDSSDFPNHLRPNWEEIALEWNNDNESILNGEDY